MKDTYTYPAVFTSDEDGFAVVFPDIPGCMTCAETESEAIRKARQALSWHLWDMEREGEIIPNPTPAKNLTKQLTDDEYLVVIEVFMPPYRHIRENRATKVTTTIPFWLKSRADYLKLNYSALLQQAIREQLGESENHPPTP